MADLIGVEAALVTSGAAAGLTLATAACVAGTDPQAVTRLPDTTGLRNEVVIERAHRNRYDHAIRQVGVTLVEYGYPRGTQAWELEAALSERTAAVAYFVTNVTPDTLPLTVVAEIAHRHGVPVIVDAAAELPPAGNLRRFVDEGADLAVFSGGKGLRGPQTTGLVLGRRDLVAASAAHANPNHAIGRPMKVGKEEMVGLLVAVELYLQESDAERIARWDEHVATVIRLLRDVRGLSVERLFPMPTGKTVPRALVGVGPDCPLTAPQLIARLKEGQPRIEVRPDPAGFIIDPQNLQPGETEIICARIRALVASA